MRCALSIEKYGNIYSKLDVNRKAKSKATSKYKVTGKQNGKPRIFTRFGLQKC
jgi:hypothetical protein